MKFVLTVLDTNTGLTVPPTDVRMHTRPQDSYEWSFLPSSEHLFRQNLSKLTTREYKQLIQGVGVVFEAVRRNPSSAVAAVNDGSRLEANMSKPPHLEMISKGETFTMSIERLSAEGSILRHEASLLKASTKKQDQIRHELERNLKRTQFAYLALRKEYHRLQRNFHKTKSTVQVLQVRLQESKTDIHQLATIAQKLEHRSELPHDLSNTKT